MKTKLTLVCLAFSAMLMAQVSNLPTVLNISRDQYYGHNYGIVPKSLSYDGTNRVYVLTDDQVSIYTNAFTPVKTFSITPNRDNVQMTTMERTVTVTVTDGGLSEKQTSFSYGDWTETETNSEERMLDYGLSFINYDTDQVIYEEESGDGLCLTQTLFNEDEKYEYLSFPISGYEKYLDNGPENTICSDCYDESTTYKETKTIYAGSIYESFNIMSEDGSTLQSISFPNGFIMDSPTATSQIIKLSDEYYIICAGKMNDSYAMLVYKINRNNSGASVQQISAPIKIAAYPSPVSRNQTVTINLSGDNNTATELQVVNMNGQILDRRTVPAGQNQTTVPASHFAPGTNLIHATQNGQPIGSTRVIVK